MFENEADNFNNYLITNGFTSYAVRKFRSMVYRFYRENARNDLPWRNTDDPYHILISEIMLQQTTVQAVDAYFNAHLALLLS